MNASRWRAVALLARRTFMKRDLNWESSWFRGFVLLALAIGLGAMPTLAGEPDTVFISRRGGTLQGTIDGAFAVSGGGTVSIQPGAQILGKLVLPGERDAAKSPGQPGAGVLSPSKTTALEDLSAGSALLGGSEVVEHFNLPKVLTTPSAISAKTVVLDGTSKTPISPEPGTSLDLRLKSGTVTLPEGDYTDVAVTSGTLVLGRTGSTAATRYHFRTLSVQPGAELRVIGPVVATIDSAGPWKGKLGAALVPFWLDLRVSAGDVTLGAQCEFYGFLLAPDSVVTLESGATATGGVVADQLNLKARARITAVQPDWSSTATDRTAPLFAHKAIRLSRQIGDLQSEFKAEYHPGVSYIGDVPYIMLAQDGWPTGHARAAAREQWAYHRAWRSIFETTRFSRAVLVWVVPATAKNGAAGARNIALTRLQFEAEVAKLGGRAGYAENLEACATDPALLKQFMEDTVALGRIDGAVASP